ncbi:hypothetical protein CO151_03300 [bacterium CG_4_9_14_3_um_filter_65_15]|nr:MAG: hypothetical protein CO151_03300 [bacterium CG_4_9_14_3_um_filter_65_15]
MTHRFPSLLFCLFVALVVGVPTAKAGDLDRHQDALVLGRSYSAVPLPDGLITVGAGIRTSTSVYLLDGQLERISAKDLLLLAEWDLLPGLAFSAEVPWHSWSGGRDWLEASGSGLGDGRWQAAFSHALVGGWLYGAVGGGGNIPLGDKDTGLGEGIFSPRASAALTLRVWRGGNLPEMRLHLNLAQTWNQAEDTGYGMSPNGLQPWPPRYPAASAAGGHTGNDQRQVLAALEFRNANTSLWLEYGRDRFLGDPPVSDEEQLATFSAGLRWGLEEGWALHGKYLVSLTQDDPATDWYPAFPEWSMSVAVSRQFGFGGRDRDGDGIADRKDLCPTEAEDRDGFQDGDGCPDFDNDGDGIPDSYDLAPMEPEDFDGFQDDDGAPDYDNDGDGIPDRDDLCPDEPENFNGEYDQDGCPDHFADADGDGVEDRRDQCPDQAEDMDGHQDDDGCPDPDNDLDGILDADDGCPNEAENYNGVDDEDGCPD